MTCELAQLTMLDEVSALRWLALKLHMLRCAACREIARQNARVLEGLAGVRAPVAPAHLLAAWTEMVGPAAKRRPYRLTSRRLAPVAVLAVLGLVAAATWMRPHESGQTQRTEVRTTPECAGSPGIAVLVDPQVAPDINSTARYGWWPDGESVYCASGAGSAQEGPRQIWRMKPDGTEKQLLVGVSNGWIAMASVSPTGQHLAYMLNGRGFRVLDLSTGETQEVPNSFGTRDVTWSPDGQYLAFSRSHHADVIEHQKAAAKRGLWVWPVGGGEPRQIVTFPEVTPGIQDTYMPEPRWSPDGDWIAFTWRRTEYEQAPDGNQVDIAVDVQLWLVHPDGSGAHRVAATRCGRFGSWQLGRQCWSPDSRRIAVPWVEVVGSPKLEWNEEAKGYVPSQDAYVPRGIATIDVSDGTVTIVVPADRFPNPKNGFSMPSNPSWSPVSRHVAFTATSFAEGRFQADEYVASVDTGALVKTTSTGTSSGMPVWSPAGDALLYSQWRLRSTDSEERQYELWLVKLGPEEPVTAK